MNSLRSIDRFKDAVGSKLASDWGISENFVYKLLNPEKYIKSKKYESFFEYLKKFFLNSGLSTEEIYKLFAEKDPPPLPSAPSGTLAAEVDRLNQENEKLNKDLEWYKKHVDDLTAALRPTQTNSDETTRNTPNDEEKHGRRNEGNHIKPPIPAPG